MWIAALPPGDHQRSGRDGERSALCANIIKTYAPVRDGVLRAVAAAGRTHRSRRAPSSRSFFRALEGPHERLAKGGLTKEGRWSRK